MAVVCESPTNLPCAENAQNNFAPVPILAQFCSTSSCQQAGDGYMQVALIPILVPFEQFQSIYPSMSSNWYQTHCDASEEDSQHQQYAKPPRNANDASTNKDISHCDDSQQGPHHHQYTKPSPSGNGVSTSRDWYELSYCDDLHEQQHAKSSLNRNNASTSWDWYKLSRRDVSLEVPKPRQTLNASLNAKMFEDQKIESQDSSCWEALRRRSEHSSCCSTASGSDIALTSSSSDISHASSRRKMKQHERKRETRHAGSTLWYSFVELADRVADFEMNDHPCIWLSALLKQTFPMTANGKDILELPPKLIGCQSSNPGSSVEYRSYAAVSVVVNPVMNAGRLAVLLASKALGEQSPSGVGTTNEKLIIAFDLLKRMPKTRVKVFDLLDLVDLQASDVSLSRQFWSGLVEKYEQKHDAPDPCSSLIAVPEELLDIWTQAQSNPEVLCDRRFVMDVARWVLRTTEKMKNDPHLEISALLFPKSTIPVDSGKRAARAWMAEYFVNRDAVRRLLECKS